jgi:serine/threonine-protein kinase
METAMKASFDLESAQWITLRKLLDTALALAPEERTTWLDGLERDFEPLKPRLQRLLALAGAETGALPLDALPKVETAQFGSDPAQQEPAALGPTSTVGPYRLIRLLGEGGMGSVWLAERTDMLHKRLVALKLPRLLTLRAELAGRLVREREILATLNHPNIARLYDAGVTADGQPYLALEYVEGRPIDAWCARRQLDVPGRLRLFLQVARAVAHAHANLVVHRDLKPNNILVTEDGAVRLLDFGIAKLIEDGGAQETELTQLAGRVLTPQYAAPEQILGHPVSTSADVYALGVVLFELLTDARPYKLKRGSRAELEDAILQADPPRPSDATADAPRRRRLRGDLDTIVLKAMKKTPAERYGTVEALAEDIERHLRQQPVLAQPDSRVYRLRKFVARNRLAVGAAGSVLLAIVLGAAASLWQANAALTQQRRAESVKDFVASIFSEADPYAASQGKAATATQLLDRARARLDVELAAQPEVRAELLRVVGRSYAGLFELATAETVLQQALERTRALGDESRHAAALAELAVNLGEVRKLLGKTAESRTLLQEALALLQRHGLQASDTYADARILDAGLALLVPDYPAARQAAREVIRVGTALHGEVNAKAATGYGLLAKAQGVSQAERDEALAAAEKSWSILRALYGSGKPHPAVMDAQHSYGVALVGIGNFAQAAPHLEQAFADARALYGPASVLARDFGARVGQVRILRGELAAGIQALRETLAIPIAENPVSPAAGGRQRALALGLLWAQRPAEAIEPLSRAIAILQQTRDVRSRLVVQADYAMALVDLGRLDEAASLLGRIGPEGDALTPREAPLRAAARLHLARGEAAQAKALLEQARAAATIATRGFFLSDILLDLGRAELALGDAGAAIARADETLEELARTRVQSTPLHASAWLLGGRALLAAGNAREALETLERADRFWNEFDQTHRLAGEAAYWLGHGHAALGQGERARLAFVRAAQILDRSTHAGDAPLRRLAQRASRGGTAGSGG